MIRVSYPDRENDSHDGVVLVRHLYGLVDCDVVKRQIDPPPPVPDRRQRWQQ